MKNFLTRLVPLVLLLAFTSEDEFHKRIQEKLNGYYLRNMPVKLSFIFNQSQYVPGDTIFFQALFLKAADHQHVPGRQIVNVDLTDHKGVTVLPHKIAVENGSASNQIILPRNIQPGAYTLVGYSNAMKNHDHRLFSYNRILISGNKELLMDSKQPLRFYPEGGALVRDVKNKIIAIGTPGEKVSITDSNDQQVSSVVLDQFGLRAFHLTPTGNETYKGVSGNNQVALPNVSSIPVSMIVTPTSADDPLEIALSKSETGGADDKFYLTIVGQRNVYYSETISFEDKRDVLIAVPYERLMPGLSLVTLFSAEGTELLKRIIFVRDRSGVALSVDTDKKIFSPREKVHVSIQLRNDRGEPVAGSISVAVQDSTLLPSRNDEMISQKLTVADLPYAALTHPGVGDMDDHTLNDFLITQDWCRFLWKDVMDEKTFNRYPAFSFVRIAGKAIHPEGKAFGDSTRITFFLHQNANTYQTYVDSAGNFNFPLAVDFENTDVYYRVETKKIRQKGIVIKPQENYNHAFTFPGAKETAQPSPLGLFTANRFLIDNAYKPALDLKNYARRSKENLDNSLSEYFVADIKIKLADYVLLPTMEETFREIVTSVTHRTVDRKSIIRVHLPDEKRWGSENPLFVIDGVITDDIDYLMSLNPADVTVIKVINTRKNISALGAIGENGVLIVETKIPNNARNVPRAANTFYAIGISRPLPFMNVTEEIFRPRVPVVRSCVYWNPELKTDAAGKATFSFYTPDNTGKFRIVMNGITEKGEPVSAVKTITVKVLPVN